MNIIDGRAHARQIDTELAQVVATLSRRPKLVIMQVANHQASEAYIKGKLAAAERIGIEVEHVNLPETVSESELLAQIEALNQDADVDGIIVQLPLPEHLDDYLVAKSIAPAKDVDGFHPANLGELLIHETRLEPCTPKGIMELLRREHVDLRGKHVVVVGRSNIVGKPIALLALQADATVTVCHSHTQNLAALTRQADVLIVAIGRANFIQPEMVKAGAVVIDVGINRVDGKLVGDVDFAAVAPLTSAITPVPGGVGPMTVAMLMQNTVAAATKK